MGVQRTIRFPKGQFPDWPAISNKLTEIGQTAVLRMIDDLPALPGEIPEPDWKEIRVGMTGGMVTLRRKEDELAVITWGDRDSALTASWQAMTWAAAVATDGTIDGLPPDHFRPHNH